MTPSTKTPDSACCVRCKRTRASRSASSLSDWGVSLGATNFVLRALMDQGAIKIRNFRGNTCKLSYACILMPHGLAEKAALAVRFLARKQKEYESLKAEIEAVRSEHEQETQQVADAAGKSEPVV